MDLAESFGLTVIDAFGRDESGNPRLEEGESILQTFNDVQLVLGSSNDQKVGKLCVTEGRIFWLNSSDSSLGFAADFTSISMHAVATDPDSVDKPCLYVQLDVEEPEIALDEDDDEDAEGPVFPELRLIPTDPATLDAIFDSFCQGAERNPDADAEEEGQGSLFFDQSEVLAGALEAAEVAEDVDELVGVDPDRFGDAEDEEEHPNGNL